MASETFQRRIRGWYASLLRFYPKAHRERFAEGMQQTFNDLCRERVEAKKGLVCFAFLIFVETSAAVVRENVTFMKRDSALLLKIVKYGAIAVAALLVAGSVTLMFLARGKGEDIAGIIAPALLLAIFSGVVATVAAVMQRRARGRSA